MGPDPVTGPLDVGSLLLAGGSPQVGPHVGPPHVAQSHVLRSPGGDIGTAVSAEYLTAGRRLGSTGWVLSDTSKATYAPTPGGGTELSQLLDQLGAQGWHLVTQVADQLVFTRPATTIRLGAAPAQAVTPHPAGGEVSLRSPGA